VEHYQRQLMTYGFTVVPPWVCAPDGLHERLLGDIVSAASEQSGPLDITGATSHIHAANPAGQQLFYLLSRGGAFIDAVANPAQLALVRHLISDAIVSSVSASLKGPNETSLPLHADQPIHPTPRSLVCTAAFLLTPMSPAEGGLCFVPYSHNRLRQPVGVEQELCHHKDLFSIEAPAGSLVIWHGNTWHGAHARSAPGIRVSLLVHWCSSLLRPREPYRELLPDRILEQGGKEFADLIGASIHFGWTESGPEKEPYVAFHTARARANANTMPGSVNMTNRPTNPPVISKSDMRPGDIILSRGGDSNEEGELLDKIILALDQGDYTHSSIWDGCYVIEALTTGVQIEDSLDLTLGNQALVDVYRAEFSGHQVGTAGWPAEPILDAARLFKGYSYGYTKLVLAGLVLLTSEVPQSPIIEAALRIFGSAAIAELERWQKTEHSMICSEVVAQAFYDGQSSPAHKYGLPVVVDDHHHVRVDPMLHQHTLAAIAPGTDPRLVEFHKLRGRLVEVYPIETVKMLSALAQRSRPFTVIGGSAELSAAFVTPGDLQRSPALKLVGTLKQPAS
jgi:hypothetical protein